MSYNSIKNDRIARSLLKMANQTAHLNKNLYVQTKKFSIPSTDYQFPQLQQPPQHVSSLDKRTKIKRHHNGVEVVTNIKDKHLRKQLKVNLPSSTRKMN